MHPRKKFIPPYNPNNLSSFTKYQAKQSMNKTKELLIAKGIIKQPLNSNNNLQTNTLNYKPSS